MCFCELCWSWDEPSSERVAPVQEDGPFGVVPQVALSKHHSQERPRGGSGPDRSTEDDREQLWPFEAYP